MGRLTIRYACFVLLAFIPYTLYASGVEENSKPNNTYTYAQLVDTFGLTEVAATITQAKAVKVLPITQSWPTNNAKAAALLTEIGCIKPSSITQLYRVESDIACELLNDIELTYVERPQALSTFLNALLKEGIVEGYNIKRATANTSNTPTVLWYGHQSLAHAKQLINLLALNDVKFSWQMHPKTSAFKVRAGWQDASGNEIEEHIRYADEYDIKLSFTDANEKHKFKPLIDTFAKRNTENQKGLIVDAWWQPFYRSTVSEAAYRSVIRISFVSGKFIASTLVLNSNLSNVLEKVKARMEKSTAKVTLLTENLWVNPSFYRYLHGEFK